MTSNGPLLELANVSKRFDALDGAPSLVVLEGISLVVNHSESLAIVGPSGSGKSTLLHIMGTLDNASSGSVTLNRQKLEQLDEKAVAAVRNHQIGFVFQFHYLLPQCTVLENVLVPTLAQKSQKKRATNSGPEPPGDRALRLLKRVGLAERLSHHPGQLSGGERQRVAVVRALINRPQLLLADEPTGALDQASAEHLAELLLQLNQEEGVALVVVTHSRELAQRMGRTLELKRGRLVARVEGN